MLWSTHRRIAEKIAKELKLSFKETDNLQKGSITPDYWKDYPHHYGKERQIRKRIVEARRLFLEDQKLESLFALGVALHYIQDRWVTIPGSDERHDWWEKQIDEAPFVGDLVETVNELGLTRLYDSGRLRPTVDARNAKKDYLGIANQLQEFHQLCRSSFEEHDGVFVEAATLNIATLRRPEVGTPVFDLNFAYRTSLLVALSLFESKTNPAISEKLELIRDEFRVKLKDAEESLARKLLELNYMNTELQRKHGLINRFKRLICNLKIWFNRRRYEKRSHLLKVQKIYYRKAKQESSTYSNWYKIIIPELDIEQVERLLA